MCESLFVVSIRYYHLVAALERPVATRMVSLSFHFMDILTFSLLEITVTLAQLTKKREEKLNDISRFFDFAVVRHVSSF